MANMLIIFCMVLHSAVQNGEALRLRNPGLDWFTTSVALQTSHILNMENIEHDHRFGYDLAIDSESRVAMEPDLAPQNVHYSKTKTRTHWNLVCDSECLSSNEASSRFAIENREIQVFFMMRHSDRNGKKLKEKLYSVSDPKSKEYGQHLDMEELKDLVPIPEVAVNTVLGFLKSHGISEPNVVKVNHNRDIIRVHIPIKTAERMFQTKIGLYGSEAPPSKFIYRAYEQYSLPKSIANLLYVVGDLANFPDLSQTNRDQAVSVGGNWENECELTSCTGLITPNVLKSRYNVPESKEVKGNSMAVAEFQGQYFDHQDIHKFSSSCHVNVTVDREVGGNREGAGIESLLDIEYIKAISPEISLSVVYADQYSLLAWVNRISNDKSPDWVHSVSYGNDENQQVSDDYIQAVNIQLMKAGIRGLSILFASGDQGVCGREGCGFFRKRFKPDFPAGSPYVTSVGGTDFSSNEIGEEKTWSCGGGGFSDHFGTPEFQKNHVEKYIKTANLPNSNLWNASGRGYPDISALGGTKAPYCVVAHGYGVGVSGTSASCPVAAGIFAKLNGIRISVGKSPLGWLNPFIYQNAAAFQDVKLGANGCTPFVKGFDAIEGWDPATGVGTPDFDRLAKIVESLP